MFIVVKYDNIIIVHVIHYGLYIYIPVVNLRIYLFISWFSGLGRAEYWHEDAWRVRTASTASGRSSVSRRVVQRFGTAEKHMEKHGKTWEITWKTMHNYCAYCNRLENMEKPHWKRVIINSCQLFTPECADDGSGFRQHLEGYSVMPYALFVQFGSRKGDEMWNAQICFLDPFYFKQPDAIMCDPQMLRI